MPNALLIDEPRIGTDKIMIIYRGCKFRADEDVIFEPSLDGTKFTFYGASNRKQFFYVDTFMEAERVDQEIIYWQKFTLDNWNKPVKFTDIEGAEYSVDPREIELAIPDMDNNLGLYYNGSKREKIIKFKTRQQMLVAYSRIAFAKTLIEANESEASHA